MMFPTNQDMKWSGVCDVEGEREWLAGQFRIPLSMDNGGSPTQPNQLQGTYAKKLGAKFGGCIEFSSFPPVFIRHVQIS